MIKSNELRLGNIFLIGHRHVIINSIHEHYQFGRYIVGTATFRIENNELKPIKLTKDLLLSCGFRDNDGLIELDWHVFRIYYTEFGILLNITGRVSESIFCKRIIYLHQLQNLIFSLTNTELEINI